METHAPVCNQMVKVEYMTYLQAQTAPQVLAKVKQLMRNLHSILYIGIGLFDLQAGLDVNVIYEVLKIMT